MSIPAKSVRVARPIKSAKPNVQRLFDAVNTHYNETRRAGINVARHAEIREATLARFREFGIADLFDWTEE